MGDLGEEVEEDEHLFFGEDSFCFARKSGRFGGGNDRRGLVGNGGVVMMIFLLESDEYVVVVIG